MSREDSYRLTLLGPFGLVDRAGRRLVVTSKRGMALLALLVLSRGGERSRAWLQDMLWGTRDREQAAASLRRELSNLRPLLNPPGEAPLFVTDSRTVRLDLSRIDVDLRRLDEDLAAGIVPEIGGGDLLEGLDLANEEGFEDWLREQRQRVGDLLEQGQRLAWRRSAERFASDDPGSDGAQAISADAAPSARPALAVVPFRHSGLDEGVGTMIAEQIGLALSRWSTLALKPIRDRLPDEFDRTRVCQAWGVRYLLEGSIDGVPGRVRVVIRLVDGVMGEQLWAERFEAETGDLMDLQDRLTETIAPLVESSIEKAERRRAVRVPLASVEARDLYWRANALMRSWEQDPTRRAVGMAEQVLVLDPDNAWAAGLAALGHALMLIQGWSPAPATAPDTIRRLCDTALRSGGDDPYVLGHTAGALAASAQDLDGAHALVSRALAINPDMPATCFWAGWIDLLRGEPASAAERFDHALRRNPQMAVRPYVRAGQGLALLALGRLGDAGPCLSEAVAHVPRFAPAVAARILWLALSKRTADAAAWLPTLEAAGGLQATFAMVRDPKQQAAIRAVFVSLESERVQLPDLHQPPAA